MAPEAPDASREHHFSLVLYWGEPVASSAGCRVRVIVVHNRYLQYGGEDAVLDWEVENLQIHGHEVSSLLETNEVLRNAKTGGLLGTAASSIWNRQSYNSLVTRLVGGNFDVVHVHNTFPRLSPSIYWAARRARVPVVQTLHNYRLVCANGLLFRNGHPCEECIGRRSTPALWHRCYRNSTVATATVVAMQGFHRMVGTWKNLIHAYVALTSFSKRMMVKGGLPPERVHVKPNFVPDPISGGALLGWRERKAELLFAGRIAYEKGLDLLLQAWAQSGHREWNLRIVGDGPQAVRLREKFGNLPGVIWHGWLEPPKLAECMQEVRYLVLPSRWYEGFPMVLVEALAHGLPCIVPDHGSLGEIADSGRTGLTFRPGSEAELESVLSRAMEVSETMWNEWSISARRRYLTNYSPEVNYTRQMEIYRAAITQHSFACRDGDRAVG